ncbi:hypothetical protein ABE488_01730 [Luteimonas sp. TWI662]|uniref:hypothetical protein n=1 Tax=Luteimonas sp. TWI662 TaxID=3136789 RepID=UPI00320A5A86
MNATSNNLLAALLLTLSGGACAVERPNPSLEERVQGAELVVVADSAEPQPFTGREFDKFYRVKVRVAGVLKGDAKMGDRIEVVVNNTIAEHRNDCCVAGKAYAMFLQQQDGKYLFVGSPLGAVPIEL